MWTLAESLLPDAAHKDEVTAYTQGLMDLGATLCVRGKPDCARCPFAADCVANVTGRQKELPGARPKKTVPTRKTWMLVLQDGDSVLLEKRPPTGIWGGLWSLPEAADEDALAAVAHSLGGSAELQRLSPFTHTFTHFKLDIEPRLGRADAAPGAADKLTVWAPLANIDAFGVPAPVRKLLDALQGSLI
jgi:A/G-specific adenine glycosylase